MKTEHRNHHIDYVELPAAGAAGLQAAKEFYSTAFGWAYQSWGDEYADTAASGVASGINADTSHRPQNALITVYADDLEATRSKVIGAQGVITKDIFSFPGGRRFHFRDPAGNELAVWSER